MFQESSQSNLLCCSQLVEWTELKVKEACKHVSIPRT